MNKMITVNTEPYQDQKPGTSGLRKSVKVFSQPNYVENFTQSILDAQPEKPKLLVIGGDCRYYTDEAITAIIKVCVGNEVARLVVGLNGLLSTPAASALIRSLNADGGIILTASHNPGGPDGDFGIKFNTANGGPAPEWVTNKIYEISKSLTRYKSPANKMPLRLDHLGLYDVFGCMVDVVDPIENYVRLMKDVFDFVALKRLVQKDNKRGFRMIADAMNGVMGPYVEAVLYDELGAPAGSAIHTRVLPDFGGDHPDPNLVYAKELVNSMKSEPDVQFGVAFDGDGDRNMILGENGFFVSPGDSLAIIAKHIKCIRFFQAIPCRGFARSFPTSPAVDRVANLSEENYKCYVTPTGWKFFGNLLDNDMISLCGEESFGTGSGHIREKDGLWACLAWLSIIAHTGKSVKQLTEEHWKTYGRDYFARLDFENCDADKCQQMFDRLKEKLTDPQKPMYRNVLGSRHMVDETGSFDYVDPVDGSVTTNQGLFITFSNGSRIVYRLSGTGSSGATVRIYISEYSKEYTHDNEEFLQELIAIAYEISKLTEYTGRTKPCVVT